MDQIWLGFAATILSIASLVYMMNRGKREDQKRLEDKLEKMATDVARILGWLEGQRDRRISAGSASDTPVP